MMTKDLRCGASHKDGLPGQPEVSPRNVGGVQPDCRSDSAVRRKPLPRKANVAARKRSDGRRAPTRLASETQRRNLWPPHPKAQYALRSSRCREAARFPQITVAVPPARIGPRAYCACYRVNGSWTECSSFDLSTRAKFRRCTPGDASSHIVIEARWRGLAAQKFRCR
jgi:hypothetical protein